MNIIDYMLVVLATFGAVIATGFSGRRGPESDDHGGWGRFDRDEPPTKPSPDDYIDIDELTTEEQEEIFDYA